MAKQKDYVLVIIPTHNRAELLPEAIESVLAQDYPYIKIAIVDDGSTDDTPILCARYAKENPDRFLYQYNENGGCASARNRGLEFITSDIGYVCFLDSDDRLMPGKLRGEVELLRKNQNADFTYGDYVVYNQETRREELRKVAAAGKPENFAIQHFLTNDANPAGILYRAEIVRHRRFREDLRYNEDSEFLQRIAIECKGVYCPEPSCWVRSHAGSKSRNLIEIHKAVLRASLDILDSYPSFYQSFAPLADRRIKQIKKALLRELILNGLWDEAEQYAKGIVETFFIRWRLSTFYRFRRYVGWILSRYL